MGSLFGMKSTRRAFLRGSAMLGMGVSLSALLGSSHALAADPKPGGRLVVGMNGDTKTLDPHVSQLSVWQTARRQIFEQLFRNTADGTKLPYLATGSTWSDPQTLVVDLREGVTFHNGEAFTADDVKYTFDRLATPDLPSEYPPRLVKLDSLEVASPTQVVFHLKSPDATFIDLLADIDIISKSVPADQLATTPVGTGPFSYVEWLPGESLRFAKYPGYYEAGLPYLDELVYRPMPDSEARIANLLSGDIDVNFDVAIKDIARLATSEGISVKKVNGGLLGIFYLNLNKAPFDNKTVRQAVLYGFDRAKYSRDFLAGLARVTNTPIDPGNFAYNAEVDTMYAYDPEKAKALLAEAGYGADKPLEIEILYPVGLEDYQTISEFFQAQMADIGAKVKVTGMELAAWSNKIIKEKDYQIAFDARSLAVTEPASAYNDTTFTKPGEGNFDGFVAETVPGYAELIEEGLVEADPAKRKDIYMKLQALWAENLPGYFVAASPNFVVTRDSVIGYDSWGVAPFRQVATWLDR